MKFYNDLQEQAKDYYEGSPIEEIETKFVANVNFDIKKNSDNILSIIVNYYKYSWWSSWIL